MCVLIDAETRTKERKGGSYIRLSLLGSPPLFHAVTPDDNPVPEDAANPNTTKQRGQKLRG